ncbi:MAG: phosphodiester glycosidase family protein, partial [Peptococcaceae bacterium]|nr:phosphodiester glycosidase family protein [Peptococcaceae bacterium]
MKVLKTKRAKKLISLVLAGAMLFLNSVPAAAASNQLVMHNSSPITSGAVLSNYTWDISDGKVKAAVLEIDLTDPYVQLEIVPGKGKFTQRATVSAMANRTNAIAMVNGDFYNTKAEGAPIWNTVIDGKLVSSQSYLNGVYCLGITSDDKAYIEQFSFEGEVRASNGEKYGLSGLNKTFYWEETTSLHSHLGRLHLYSDMWGGSKRGMDSYVGVPAEVMVKNNRVIETAFDGGFDSAVPEGCYILHGDGKAADFLKNNMKVNDYIQMDYTYAPMKNWQMVIGGHALLVDNGQPVKYTKDLSALGGVRARTAAGISKDGKKVYIVAVEGRTSDSKGITLGNLSLLMTRLGVWKAMNLDGGGSTTMVSR